MKTETFKGDINTAYGEKLSKPVKYSGSFEAFETLAEAKSANKYPDDDEILKFINDTEKANARSKAVVQALTDAGYTKPDREDPRVIWRTMFAQLMLSKRHSEAKARALVNAALGYEENGPYPAAETVEETEPANA